MSIRTLSIAALVALASFAPPALAAGTAATVMSNATVGKDADRNAAGRTVLVWEYGYDIYARVFDASGTALTLDLRLTNTATRNDLLPEVAVFADGRFVVMWETFGASNTNDQKLIARWYSSLGVAETEEVIVTAESVNTPNYYASLDAGGDGTVAIAYKLDGASTQETYLRLYSSTGTATGSLVTDVDGRTTDNLMDSIEIGRADDGRMVAVFGAADGVWIHRLNADGSSADEPDQASVTPSAYSPRIAVAGDGRFVVAWRQSVDAWRYVIARAFDADGTPASGEVAISPVFPESGYMVQDSEPVVAIDSAANYTVVFTRNDRNDDAGSGDSTSHYDLWRRAFTRGGVEIGSLAAIATDASVHEISPLLAFDASGGGAVFWEQGTSSSNNPAFTAGYTSLTATDVSLSVLAPTVRKTKGDKVKFTYTASNAGPTAAAGVTVAFTAPIQFRPLSALVGTTPCAVAGQTVTCTVGALASGTSRTGSVTVKALKVGTFALAGTVTTTSLDVDATDNAASASKRIRN